MAIDPLFAQWLMSPAQELVRTDAAAAGRWGASAATSARTTGIATLAAAEAEADRQLAFFALGPFAIDVHQLVGSDWHRAIGRIVTLTVAALGYHDGRDVFVLGAEADRSTGLSSVTVLCPIGGGA